MRPNYRGMQCHYCEEPATTRDHIVPRSVIRATGVTYCADVPNTVPACSPCNQRKSSARVVCECNRCVRAWAVYGPLDPKVMKAIPVMTLAELTAA